MLAEAANLLNLRKIMDKEYTFTLTESEINIINAGLQELPFKLAVMVINKMSQQFREQQAIPQE